MRKPLPAEAILYRLGLLLLPVFFLGALAVCAAGDRALTWLPPCRIHAVTGLFCPGCGATRAIVELARLHLAESFCYHPFVPYTALVYAAFLLWETVRRRTGWRPFPILPFIYAGIALLVLQFLWKNAALAFGWNPFLLI